MGNAKILSIKNVIVFVLILAIITLAIFSLDILMMLFAAFVITCAISPVINQMEKRIPRIWCVTIILLGLILACVLIVVPLLVVSVKEGVSFLSTLPSMLDNFDNILNFKIFDRTLASLITFDSIKDTLAQGAQGIIENSITAGKFIANLLTTLIAIAIMVFYFAYDEKRLIDKFIEFFPPEHKETAGRILENISSKVGNYLLAQGIAMFFVGALTTVGLLLLHNDHAFLLGFLTCVLDIIPVIGPCAAIAIGLITCIPQGFGYVLAAFAVYLLAQFAQNQFLRPVLFGKMLNMHPLVIIVSLLVCARFLGFWGIILAPAIASVICVLVDELYLNRINENS